MMLQTLALIPPLLTQMLLAERHVIKTIDKAYPVKSFKKGTGFAGAGAGGKYKNK